MALDEFLKNSLADLHKSIAAAVGDLTLDQWHWRPNDKGIHIAFIVWHYARTEDGVIQSLLQQKQAIWVDGQWDQKFGLDPRAQGTGMTEEDAAKLRVNSKEDFLSYCKAVWEATEEYVASRDDAQLLQNIQWGRRGEVPVARLVGNVLMTHGYGHLGEISLLRGLMGLKGTGL